jgi:hypothetical protein
VEHVPQADAKKQSILVEAAGSKSGLMERIADECIR